LPDGTASNFQDGCWHPKSFDKAVIIIIDALRYDFTVPFQNNSGQPTPGFYNDKMPFLYETAASHPENAILLPFIADPPTSTLQRLQGITTGNLPVFLDIGSNFAGQAIEEDNLLVQLRKAGRSIVHLGDDTWHSLFPGYFDANLTHAYDSFNVWDLHTVDNGVLEHIMPLLDTEVVPQWDVIFAHFLGVDHAGHRYGPDHQAMADKLQQMNVVLSNIVQKIDDQTLLVVMGDHGMDTKGDHGGESDDEVEAALWMYSKQPRFGRLSASDISPPLSAKERPVGQIDLVSTLSLLLGLPIPFNNLGTPIVEAFAGNGDVDWYNLAQVNLLAFEQIQNYQSAYSRTKDLDVNERQHEKYLRVKQALRGSGSDKWRKVNVAYADWHSETTSMYRKLWANFNIPHMLHGLEVLTGSLVLLFMISRCEAQEQAPHLPSLLRNIGLGIGAGASVGPLLGVVFQEYFTAVAGTSYGAAVGGVVGAIVALYRTSIVSLGAFGISPMGWLSVTFTLLQSIGFAANSFTIHEDTILLLFLSTFGMVTLISSLRQAYRSDRVLGTYHSVLFVLLARAASFSRLCREEQMPGCRSTFYASSTSSTSAPWQLFISFAVALLLPEIIKAFYRGTASYAGSAPFWIGFPFRMGLLFVAAYWTIDAADNGGWMNDRVSSTTLKTISIGIARCVLAIAIPIGAGTFIWAQPCINIILKKNDVSVQPMNSTSDGRPQLTILGYANAFGSRYFLLVPAVALSIILLLPPMGQFALAICLWQILCLMEILDANGLTVSSGSRPSIGPIVLAMLGSYHFFKTGHQAVLSSIQWNAAFVPLRSIHYPWSPLLIVLNNFGAQILCSAAVPLTVLWKRPISKDGLRAVWDDVMNACLTHSLYYATVQLATMMWSGHLRRHLMLYRVFMPRFLMASGVLVVVDLVIIFIALVGVSITGLSVGEVFGY